MKFLFPFLFFSLSLMAQELPVKLSGDAYVRGFTKDQARGADAKGFAQMIRVGADFKAEEGVQVKTRTVLSGTTWEGDIHTTNADKGNNNPVYGQERLRLDYGFIEIPKNGFTLRAGRQVADWGECFNTCDDRRDRILLLKQLGPVFAGIDYDKRYEGAGATEGDDVDMWALVLFSKIDTFDVGMLTGYWTNMNAKGEGYRNLNHVLNVSPTLKGKMGNLEINGVYNYLGQGERYSTYPDSHHAAFMRLGYPLGLFKIEAQGVWVINGGLVATGFDTFSSLVNNNQTHNASNTSQITLTGLGTKRDYKKDDHQMYATRLSYDILSDLKGLLALGHYTTWNNTLKKDEKNLTYDAGLVYNFTPKTKLSGKYGLIDGDNHFDGASFELSVIF